MRFFSWLIAFIKITNPDGREAKIDCFPNFPRQFSLMTSVWETAVILEMHL